MLDVIADFWKPVKKGASMEKLEPDQLQIGSSIGFGFVPQAILSGRRLQVSGINTYQFGDEGLTSFVLTQDKDPGVSMIVAEAEGEQYLAISRRLSIAERMKLFDSQDLENVMTKNEIVRLTCKDNVPEFKGWVVGGYKREIQGLKGRLCKGDYRKSKAPAGEGLEFQYTLLVSDSNEHAIEIEKYNDGRIELFATVYRRLNDIGEITHPVSEQMTRPDIKLASNKPDDKPVTPPAASNSPSLTSSAPAAAEPAKAAEPLKIVEPVKAAEPPKPAEPAKAEPVMVEDASKVAPIKLQEFTQPLAPPVVEEAKPKAEMKVEQVQKPVAAARPPEEKKAEAAINGSRTDHSTNATQPNKPKVFVQSTAPESFMKQEVKAVNNNKEANGFDADAIECDLRVANKIIDEAIRNEMRLTDIVRRIIELPVAYPESVQIPITLTDEDYALLAIRYGISASDRNSIKRRILEDLNDFSGNNIKKFAA